jgi:abequosyltransferase
MTIFLLPGYLKFIINLLDREDWGTLYINTQWYSGEYKAPGTPPAAISFRQVYRSAAVL